MEFEALPWCDQRMYIEQLAIFHYYKQKDHWDHLSEEDQWLEPEPEKPMVLLIEESEEEEEFFESQGIPPDILN